MNNFIEHERPDLWNSGILKIIQGTIVLKLSISSTKYQIITLSYYLSISIIHSILMITLNNEQKIAWCQAEMV